MPSRAVIRLRDEVPPGEVLTRDRLIARFGRHVITDAVKAGAIERVLQGVYATPPAHTFECRALAASTWLGDRGILSGITALRLLSLVDRGPAQVAAIVPTNTRLTTPTWLHLRRSDQLVPRDWADGMFVARADHALVQAWRPGREAMLIDAVRRRVVRSTEIADVADRYPRITGRRELQRLLTHLEGGVESYLEWIGSTQVFTGREFAAFKRQVSVIVDGRRYVLDLWHEQARLAIELDGQAYHTGDAARQRDLTRDADLATLGVLTLRFTYGDITG